MEAQDPQTPQRLDNGNRTVSEESEKRLGHFIRMLSDENPGNRWKAADSLGRLGDLRATEALIDALWDDDAHVRKKAAWALGSLGDPRAVVPLRRLYRMETADTRDIIEEALAEITRGIGRQ